MDKSVHSDLGMAENKMDRADADPKGVPAKTSFQQLNETRKPILGVQWPICKRKNKVPALQASSSSHLPPKNSKFSIYEDISHKGAPAGAATTSVMKPVNSSVSDASTGTMGDTMNADGSLDLTFDTKKRFYSYRAPLSEISFRSDTSIVSDSGVSAMDELEGDYDADGNLNTENKQKVLYEKLRQKNLLLSSTRKNLAKLCQPPKGPGPVLPDKLDPKKDDADENLKATSPFLPPSVAKKFAPVGPGYCRVGGTGGVLSERKYVLYDFPEYATDIITYWLGYEKRVRPKRWYMEKQPDISYKMRTILVDWLVEVGEEYEMHHETVFQAVSCLDRFLSKMSVTRSKLQLVGTSALFTCSKFEEIQPPDVNDFVTITDNTYTKEQVVHMERIVLSTLGFDLLVPTAFDFVRTFSTLLYLDSQTTCLAMYLTELSLLDAERYLPYLPSIIATAAISLARYTFQNRFWDSRIAKLTTHKLMDIQRCAQHLFNSFYDAPTFAQTAIFEKYKAVRYCSISLCILPAKLPWNL